MAFDTYKAVKELDEVGFDENAARTMVSMVSSVFTDNVATKSDIADMATKNDLSNLHFQMKADMKDLENRVTMRFAWMALAIVGLTSTIVGLLNQLQG